MPTKHFDPNQFEPTQEQLENEKKRRELADKILTLAQNLKSLDKGQLKQADDCISHVNENFQKAQRDK